MSIRTVIVDNDPELLDKLTGILEDTEEIELRGRFEHPADVLAIVEREPVDLVFSDVLLSDIPGLSIKTWNIRAFGFVPKPYTRGDIAGMVSLYRESMQGR